MNYETWLSTLSNWAAILTAVIAVLAFGQFQYLRISRRVRLENYLRTVRSEDQGQKSVMHLMARLSMTEAEVMTAGFHSRKIKALIKADEEGIADVMLFQYIDG